MYEWPPEAVVAVLVVTFLVILADQLLISLSIYGLLILPVFALEKRAYPRFFVLLAASFGTILCLLPLVVWLLFNAPEQAVGLIIVLVLKLRLAFIVTLGIICVVWPVRWNIAPENSRRSDLVLSGILLVTSSAAFLWQVVEQILDALGPP